MVRCCPDGRAGDGRTGCTFCEETCYLTEYTAACDGARGSIKYTVVLGELVSD